MTTASAYTLLLLLLLALHSITHGYSVQRPIRKSPPSSSKSSSTPKQHQSPTVGNIHRSTFLSIASTSCLLFPFISTYPDPAHAKDVDPALKGTKADPAFQACLGQCMYECTKPKGSEQRSRAECLPECKSKCATSKEQLMTGTPLKKE